MLLLWSSGQVPDVEAPADFAGQWLSSRSEKTLRAAESRGRDGSADQEAARKRAEQRATRVAAGLDELDRWLRDQVRTGLAGTERAGYAHFDSIAARLVDAQAPAVAGAVRGLAGVAVSGADWPGRLLAEYGLLRLLVVAHRQLTELPASMAATVRGRVGYPVAREEVLGGREPVRDRWSVMGLRDSAEDRLTARRVWLHGSATGRMALVLSFAATGQPLDALLVSGTTIDADVHFYPGSAPLRALVGVRHGEPAPLSDVAGGTIDQALDGWAAALAADPWLSAWPVLLGDVVPIPGETRWRLVDATGGCLPSVSADADLWRLLAVSGGSPVTVFGEWTPAGLRAVSAINPDGLVAL